MVAIYPSAVKTFQYRQDYTELVEAADINVAYDELGAVETVLGVNPQSDLIDGKTSSWTTVGQRISAVSKGVSKPFCNVSSNNFTIAYNTITTVSWTSKTWDTHKMATGTNLTCPRSGVYCFDAYIRWHKDNQANDNQQPVFDRNGKLEIALQIVDTGAYSTAQTGFFPIGYQKATRQSTSTTIPWQAGQKMVVTVSQSCLSTPITGTVICSATYHRDPPTLNNL